jgi:hypothetical protein
MPVRDREEKQKSNSTSTLFVRSTVQVWTRALQHSPYVDITCALCRSLTLTASC